MTYDSAESDGPPTVPTPLRLAALVAAVEGVTAIVLGVLNLVWMEHPSIALTNLTFFGLIGVGLVLAARGMLRLRSWSRSVILLGQVFAMAPIWTLRHEWSGLPSLVCGLIAGATALLMLSPSTADLLYTGRREGDVDEDLE